MLYELSSESQLLEMFFDRISIGICCQYYIICSDTTLWLGKLYDEEWEFGHGCQDQFFMYDFFLEPRYLWAKWLEKK